MPNMCFNCLTVTGTASELDRFLEAARGRDDSGGECPFSLRRLFPIPAHLDTGLPIRDTSQENWYLWCIRNWGTKWDVKVTTWERHGDQEWRVLFRSAWSAPEEAFTRRIAPAFPDLTFVIHFKDEDGSGEAEYRWRAGKRE